MKAEQPKGVQGIQLTSIMVLMCSWEAEGKKTKRTGMDFFKKVAHKRFWHHPSTLKTKTHTPGHTRPNMSWRHDPTVKDCLHQIWMPKNNSITIWINCKMNHLKLHKWNYDSCYSDYNWKVFIILWLNYLFWDVF